jgi:hypothetical protein
MSTFFSKPGRPWRRSAVGLLPSPRPMYIVPKRSTPLLLMIVPSIFPNLEYLLDIFNTLNNKFDISFYGFGQDIPFSARELFGWKIEKTPGPMDYWMMQTVPTDEKGMPIRPGVNGGMMKRQNPEHKPVNYIAVESVDDYSQKIETLGGKVIVPS